MQKLPPDTSTANKIAKSDAEWQAELSPEAFRVTREHGTERPFSSPLDLELQPGIYTCVCCGEPVFVSDSKFDSGCGWPSFTAPARPAAIESTVDLSHGMRREEVHCAKCDAHLGHVFPDGPGPTGLRYCINGVSLNFKPLDGDGSNS